MTQRESKLSNRIMTSLRHQGVFCFKVWGNDMMMAGLPDIVCCVDGFWVGLETKLPESRSHVSPRQHFVHEQVKRAGGRVKVVCSVKEANAYIAALKQELSRRTE